MTVPTEDGVEPQEIGSVRKLVRFLHEDLLHGVGFVDDEAIPAANVDADQGTILLAEVGEGVPHFVVPAELR